MTVAMWTVLCMIFLISVATLLIGARARTNELRNIVFDHLDEAYSHSPGVWETADEIAYNLAHHAELCGGYLPQELAPYVREWLQRRERV